MSSQNNKEYKQFLNKYLTLNPFHLKKKQKFNLFKNGMNILTKYHYLNNKIYKKLIDKFNFNLSKNNEIEKLPFLPVTVFKNFEIFTSDLKEIDTIATSSGTSNKKISKIFLDKNNSLNQIRVLNKILTNYFGNKKYPMLVLSRKPKVKLEHMNAKLAAIKGFSVIASEIFYCLDEYDYLDTDVLKKFASHPSKRKYIFGFTADIWQKFYLSKIKFNKKVNLSNVTIIHGGGWKKLENLKVDNLTFKNKIKKKFKIKKIINYYGMIEQTGSIFLECDECNNFFPSIYSDIFIRDENLKTINNKLGLIQLMSLLPTSYPGHNILTEDIGQIVFKKCKHCNSRNLKQFKVHGRVKNSEIRGCSNI